MSYVAPATLEEALGVLGRGGARVIAGGTDWFPAQGRTPLSGTLLDVTRVAGLRGIERAEGGWRIGAATTWSDVLRADLPPAFDGLRAAAREVGSVQIQNAGTVAGNLCNASPAADGAPPLLTLDAEVVTATGASRGGERVMPLRAFLTGPGRTALAPGEMVTALRIPDPPGGAGSAFLKLGARRHMVISIVMVAALVVVEEGRLAQARVAVGACSPVARRLPDLEAALMGRPVRDLRVTPDLLSGLAPISDVRGSEDYRLEAAAELVARAVAGAVGAARA